jgi:hypothetical protein
VQRANVMIAAETRNGEITRARFGSVSGCAPRTRSDFMRRAVAPAATIRTAHSPIFDELRSLGYGHVMAGGASSVPSGVLHMGSLLSLWIYGTDSVSQARLGYYLDELAFRFNHRHGARAEDRQGHLFAALIRRATRVATLTS